jgi:hypothetical protein
MVGVTIDNIGGKTGSVIGCAAWTDVNDAAQRGRKSRLRFNGGVHELEKVKRMSCVCVFILLIGVLQSAYQPMIVGKT